MFRDLKDTTIVLNTSRPTALSEEDGKDPRSKLKRSNNFQKSSTLRQNIIKLYGIIWGQCSPELQIELEGDPEYITKYLT